MRTCLVFGLVLVLSGCSRPQYAKPPVFPTVEEYVQELHSANPRTRQLAAYNLAALGPKAEAAVPALRELLRDADNEVRMAAVVALGDVGPAAGAAVPDLRPLLEDKDQGLRLAAAEAIAFIVPKDPAA
jgi:HEAT repeat protein